MIAEGDSRKSPQNKTNQTSQVDKIEKVVVLQVQAESKELGEMNIPTSTNDSKPVEVLKDRSAKGSDTDLTLFDEEIDIYEDKQKSRDEEDDSSSDSSDDYRLMFDWSSLLPEKKEEEVVVPIHTVLGRFYNDDPSLRLDALPLKVL